MDAQPSLFDDAVIRPLIAPQTNGEDTEQQFYAFLRANPWVFGWFKRRALELVHRGYQRIGINMLTEVFRYELMQTTYDPSSSYKINNNYAPFMARELARSDVRLRDVFEFRRSVADKSN